MRLLLLASLLATVTHVAPAWALSASDARQEAKQFLARCPAEKGDDREICLHNQKEFIEDYVYAKSGDYDDQRNVMFMLEHGADGAIAINWLQACAWNLYVVSTGNPRLSSSDLIVGREVCSHLDGDAANHLAVLRVNRIATDIRQTPRHIRQ